MTLCIGPQPAPEFGRMASVTRRSALALPGVLGASAAFAQPGALVLTGRDGWLFPVWDRLDRVDSTVHGQTAQLMADTATAFRAVRIEVVVCVVPSKAVVYRRFLAPGTQIAPAVEQRFAVTAAPLRQAGALVPDVPARFREVVASHPEHLLFFKTDTHWTPLGAELAAITIAGEMNNRLRLPPSPRPGVRLGPPRAMTLAQGNLVALLPENRRAGFSAESSSMRDAAPAEGPAGLLEDDSHDVVVVGTSNVQPRFGFVPVLSHLLNRPVGLFWRPNNIGIWAATLEYLRSPIFRQNRPRVLVWNINEADTVLPSSAAWGQNAIGPQEYLAQLRRGLSA